MPSQRFRKTYTPIELQLGIKALQNAGVANPADTVIKLYKLGYRVVNVGIPREGAALTTGRNCHTSAR